MTDYPTSIRLPSELKRALTKFSNETGWPLSRLIVYICQKWKEQQDKLERKK